MQYRRASLASNSLLKAGPKHWDSLPDNMKEVILNIILNIYIRNT